MGSIGAHGFIGKAAKITSRSYKKAIKTLRVERRRGNGSGDGGARSAVEGISAGCLFCLMPATACLLCLHLLLACLPAIFSLLPCTLHICLCHYLHLYNFLHLLPSFACTTCYYLIYPLLCLLLRLFYISLLLVCILGNFVCIVPFPTKACHYVTSFVPHHICENISLCHLILVSHLCSVTYVRWRVAQRGVALHAACNQRSALALRVTGGGDAQAAALALGASMGGRTEAALAVRKTRGWHGSQLDCEQLRCQHGADEKGQTPKTAASRASAALNSTGKT